MYAGRKGRIEAARLLIKRGAEIDARDIRGRTALFHAVCFARVEFVEFLAKLGANLSPVDMHGCSPLDIARQNVDHPSKQMIALLESLGAIARKVRRR